MKDSTRSSDMISMLLIVLVAMIGLMGIDIHLSSMPYIMSYMHTDKQHLQLSISIYLVGLSLSLFISGPASDKYGRKPVVILGLIFSSISCFAAVFASSISVFLILRLLQGVGAGACSGLGRTMAVDMYHKKSIKMVRHYFAAVIGLSPLLAPMVGGYIQHYFFWQANFIFLSICFILLAISYGLFCQETNSHIRRDLHLSRTLLPTYILLLKNWEFIGAALVAGIGMAVVIVYVTISPFVFHSVYHLTPIQYGWVTSSVALGIFLARLTNGYIVRKKGNLDALKLGILLIFVSGVWISILTVTNVTYLAITLIGSFVALYGQLFMRANAMYVALLPHKDQRGSAGALFSAFQTLISFVCGALISLFSTGGVLLMGLSYMALGLIAYWIYEYRIKYSVLS